MHEFGFDSYERVSDIYDIRHVSEVLDYKKGKLKEIYWNEVFVVGRFSSHTRTHAPAGPMNIEVGYL